MAPTIKQLKLNQDRIDKRARATSKLGHFQDEVMRRALSWTIAARKVGEFAVQSSR
jgi:hypothetical protein